MSLLSSRDLLVLGAILIALVLGGLLNLLLNRRRRPGPAELAGRFGLVAGEPPGGEGFVLRGEHEGFAVELRSYPDEEAGGRLWKTAWVLELGGAGEPSLAVRRRALVAEAEAEVPTGDARFDEAFAVSCAPAERLGEVLGAEERGLILAQRALREVVVDPERLAVVTDAEPTLAELAGLRELALRLGRLTSGRAS